MIISAPRASAVVNCPDLPGSFGATQTIWTFDTTAGSCKQTIVGILNGFRIITRNNSLLFYQMFTAGISGFFDTSTVYAANKVTAVSITPSSGNNISGTVNPGFGVVEVQFSVTDVGEQTYVMTVTKDAIPYTVTVIGTFVKGRGRSAGIQDVTSITVTGGAFSAVDAAAAAALALAADPADAAQAMTSAFADTGVRTHNWSTQTQVFGRLFGGTGTRGTVGDDGGADFAPNVARPSGLNFHSAEIRNDLQARRLQMLAESYSEIQNSTYYGASNNDETNKLDQRLMANLALASSSPDGTGLYDVWASGGYAKMELNTLGAAYLGQLFYGRVGADYKLNDTTLLGLGFGYEIGQADVAGDNTDYNSQAFSLAGYWGVKLSDTLLFDGSAGYAFVNYDFKGDSNDGDFDAGRLFATANLTGIYELPDMLQVRPKVGLLYSNEHQQAYTDGGGTANAARTLELGRLTFGGELHFPGFDKVQPYITAQGEWDFIRPDTVTLSNGSDYRASMLGASLGTGMIIDLMPNLQGSVEVSVDSIGREEFDAWSTRGKILYLF